MLCVDVFACDAILVGLAAFIRPAVCQRTGAGRAGAGAARPARIERSGRPVIAFAGPAPFYTAAAVGWAAWWMKAGLPAAGAGRRG